MKCFDTYNMIVGGMISVLTIIFGEHYILFVSFILLNIIDYGTGILKAHLTNTKNSIKGWTGILKKLGYWIMILVSFLISMIFIDIGVILEIDLEITKFIGWYVLGTLMINEVRSIIENLVEAGFNVPAILIDGLEIIQKKMEEEHEL